MALNRRTFIKAAAGVPLAMALGGAAAGKAPEKRPNVLIIITDQQFAEAMSCRLGKQHLNTPAMDQLAAGGMLFTRAYSPNPLCVPARTSIFTGRYPSETGIQTNDMKKLDPERFTCLGTLFKTNGYDTAYCGKWHLPFPIGKIETHGFDWTRGGSKDVKTAADTITFIKTRREKPFLLVASFLNPHNICEWSRGQALPCGPIGDPPAVEQCPPRRPNYAAPQDEPEAMTLMRRSYQSAKLFPVGGFDEKKWCEYIWAYYRMIEKVDGLIGQVLDALKASGAAENTLILFMADHGDCQGAHGWNQKTVFYDESARVPFILHYPGAIEAGVSDRLVNTGVDLLPTLCDYAGIPIPKGLHGLSLKGTGNDAGGADSRQYVVVSHKMVQGAEVDGKMPVCNGRMVRSRRFKYCAYDLGGRRESLVDMEADPGEMINLAGKAEYAAELKRHREYLQEWQRKVGDPFPE